MKRSNNVLSNTIGNTESSRHVLPKPPIWENVPNEVCQFFLFPTGLPVLEYEVEFEIFLSWRTVSKWFEELVESTCIHITMIPRSIFKILTPEILEKFKFTRITGIKNYITHSLKATMRTVSFKRLDLFWVENDGDTFPVTTLQHHKYVEKLSIQSSAKITYEHIQMFTNLTALRLVSNQCITGNQLTNFTNLTWLKIGEHTAITSDSLMKLTNLTVLDIGNEALNLSICSLTKLHELQIVCTGGNIITDMQHISRLPNLRKLRIIIAYVADRFGLYNSHMSHIKKYQIHAFKVSLPNLCVFEVRTHFQILHPHHMVKPIGYMDDDVIYDTPVTPNYSNLHTLDINNCVLFTDQHIQQLTGLTSLKLDYNKLITDCSLSILTKLSLLSIGHNEQITDNSLSILTSLTNLNLYSNHVITNESLSLLTGLRILNIAKVSGDKISGKSLHSLTDLTDLDITSSYTIVNSDIKPLYKLKRLILRNSWYITKDAISGLTNLVVLAIPSEEGIMSSNIFDLCHRERK